MKRILALLMVLTLVIPCALAADYESMSKEELVALVTQYAEKYGELDTADETPAEETTEESADGYTELTKGDKGDKVVKLQERLKELNYLSGSCDGDYGNGTAKAIKEFQSTNGLDATGTADVATQEALFSDDAIRSVSYEKLEYKKAARDPGDYEGRYVRFDGKVLQVIEDGAYVSFRVATKGRYDDVVYVVMKVPENYSRILDDDKVTVTGQYAGLLSYESTGAGTITIPRVNATDVSLRG